MIAAVIIISLLVVLLIHIRNNKQTSGEQDLDSDKIEGSVLETTNTFTSGVMSTNIEEDPFADDFKEDKFIDQI